MATQQRDGKGRFARQDGTNRANSRSVPRESDLPVSTPVALQRGWSLYYSVLLQQPDIAVRQNKALQRQMRRDPDIMSPFNQRRYAVALLDWSIAPEDSRDETQVAQAQVLERAIRKNLRRPVDFLTSVLEAIFYGPSLTQLTTSYVDGLYVPSDWMPIHNDL